MERVQHHFGVDSQVLNTDLVFANHTILVLPADMKGKYPNGLGEVMKRRDMSQAALAEAVGTSQQQIGKLVHGEREMTASWAEKLAVPLRTQPELLVFPSLRRIRIPLVSWVSAGRMSQQDGVRKSDIKKYLLAADLPRGDWVALQVSGDSMNLVAPEGSYIFVNRADSRLVNDAFYVFETPEGDVTFKRYRGGARPRLQPFSTNPDHETIHPTGELSVFGRVGRVVNDLL